MRKLRLESLRLLSSFHARVTGGTLSPNGSCRTTCSLALLLSFLSTLHSNPIAFAADLSLRTSLLASEYVASSCFETQADLLLLTASSRTLHAALLQVQDLDFLVCPLRAPLLSSSEHRLLEALLSRLSRKASKRALDPHLPPRSGLTILRSPLLAPSTSSPGSRKSPRRRSSSPSRKSRNPRRRFRRSRSSNEFASAVDIPPFRFVLSSHPRFNLC